MSGLPDQWRRGRYQRRAPSGFAPVAAIRHEGFSAASLGPWPCHARAGTAPLVRGSTTNSRAGAAVSPPEGRMALAHPSPMSAAPPDPRGAEPAGVRYGRRCGLRRPPAWEAVFAPAESAGLSRHQGRSVAACAKPWPGHPVAQAAKGVKGLPIDGPWALGRGGRSVAACAKPWPRPSGGTGCERVGRALGRGGHPRGPDGRRPEGRMPDGRRPTGLGGAAPERPAPEGAAPERPAPGGAQGGGGCVDGSPSGVGAPCRVGLAGSIGTWARWGGLADAAQEDRAGDEGDSAEHERGTWAGGVAGRRRRGPSRSRRPPRRGPRRARMRRC